MKLLEVDARRLVEPLVEVLLARVRRAHALAPERVRRVELARRHVTVEGGDGIGGFRRRDHDWRWCNARLSRRRRRCRCGYGCGGGRHRSGYSGRLRRRAGRCRWLRRGSRRRIQARRGVRNDEPARRASHDARKGSGSCITIPQQSQREDDESGQDDRHPEGHDHLSDRAIPRLGAFGACARRSGHGRREKHAAYHCGGAACSTGGRPYPDARIGSQGPPGCPPDGNTPLGPMIRPLRTMASLPTVWTGQELEPALSRHTDPPG